MICHVACWLHISVLTILHEKIFGSLKKSTLLFFSCATNDPGRVQRNVEFKCLIGLYSYRAFYSVLCNTVLPLTHSQTHPYSSSSAELSLSHIDHPLSAQPSGVNLGISILPNDTLACKMGETGIRPSTFSSVDNPLYLMSHSRQVTGLTKFVWNMQNHKIWHKIKKGLNNSSVFLSL